MKVYEMLGWEWFDSGECKRGGNTGKFLIFSLERDVLCRIAKDEVSNGGFNRAKVILEEGKIGTDYVLCLYARDNSRLDNMRKKYGQRADIRFKNWKSDEDTRAGKYSPQFVANRNRRANGPHS